MSSIEPMTIFAAVTTGMGTGALSTIQVFGNSPEALIKQIFRPRGTRPPVFKTGDILIGTICQGDQVIDEVTIGCEGPATFAIHCHGNPLIVELIMEQLQRCGATLLTAEQLLAKTLMAQQLTDTIAVEAKLAQAEARTLQGTKIVANQLNAGLGKKARHWLANIAEISLETITAEAAQILQESQAAKLIICGCTVVLAGPPNSGKSTLANHLAGRRKSIVTGVRGTTRDWVEATCQIGPLSVTLIDTAGLGAELLGSEDTVEQAAREKTTQILERADLVMLVLDVSRPAEELDRQIIEKLAGKNVIGVLNKSDLPARFDTGTLPRTFSNIVRISAREGTGIGRLKEEICRTVGVADVDPHQPVCFTTRQETLLKQITTAQSAQDAASIITELLSGPVRV
ncbi:MAG: 50S ribosome-binding GTPase [Phycisphaerales bacterium]|nr:MAG: 50S ribosome-binding GTPase [Phycisphaerales bacterium]